MEFITDNGKIAAEKALSQISQVQSRKISNFEIDDKASTESLLREFYRKQMNSIEDDTRILNGYISKVVDWMQSGKRCLILMGGVGCGKTTMLKAICKMIGYVYYSNISYERKAFQWETAYKVAEWAQIDKDRYEDFKECEWAAIDDIGQESTEINSYGNIIYPIRDIILHRYEQDKITIVSTNLLPKDLTVRYGERVGDRLAEMAYVIMFNEQSYRQ